MELIQALNAFMTEALKIFTTEGATAAPVKESGFSLPAYQIESPDGDRMTVLVIDGVFDNSYLGRWKENPPGIQAHGGDEFDRGAEEDISVGRDNNGMVAFVVYRPEAGLPLCTMLVISVV